jgi:hypothetical protein
MGGKTPGYLTHSPVPDAKAQFDDIVSEILPSTRDDQNELRSACLRRDNWRCVMTGRVDFNSVLQMPALEEEVREKGIDLNTIQCAHILPLALANFDENRDLEVNIFVPPVLSLDLTRDEGV